MVNYLGEPLAVTRTAGRIAILTWACERSPIAEDRPNTQILQTAANRDSTEDRKPPSLSDKSAAWSAIFAGASAVVGAGAAFISWRAARLSANVARRQSLFQLDAKWSDVNELRPDALIGPDVRNAVNALEMTASCWHHDVVEKAQVIQLYWPQYKTLYDTIVRCDAAVPGYGRPAKSFISDEVRKAYLAMRSAEEKGLPITSTI